MDELQLKEALASAVQEGGKEALAQIIVEYVQPQHVTSDFMSLLLDSRSLKPGDSLLKKLRKGLKVRTLVPGSIHLKSEITVTDRMNYILDGANIGVTANEWELEAGDIGTVSEIRNEMLAKLRDFYYGKVFTALSTVWSATNTPSNYTNVGGAITATALENAIDRINQTTGGVKAVVGSRAAMTPITKFGAFWNDHQASPTIRGYDPAIGEIMQTGMLGRYYGADLITIEQVYDNPVDYQKLIPEDKIVVIGHKVGEFITYGDVKEKQWTDMRPTPPQWNLEFYQQFGMIIDKADGIYVLKVA
jgi:hypothetical protein